MIRWVIVTMAEKDVHPQSGLIHPGFDPQAMIGSMMLQQLLWVVNE